MHYLSISTFISQKARPRRPGWAALCLVALFAVMFCGAVLLQGALPTPALAAVPASSRGFNTQSNHVGMPVHNSGITAAFCVDFRVAPPRNLEMSRSAKLSRAAGSEGRALSIVLDLGPRNTSSSTRINGISLSNLEWRMATQMALFRIQGESLSEYSTSTDHWHASTWMVNQAQNANTVQRNRYWRYDPPSSLRIQRMVLAQGDPLTARVRVTKRDASTNRVLSGARFGIWTDRSAAASANTNSSSFIRTSTSGSDGNAWWYRLPVGETYYIRELTAPSGYLLNTTVLTVRPSAGDDSEASSDSLPSILAGTIANNPEPLGSIEITKQSVSPNNLVSNGSVAGNSAYSLAGAVYGIWTNQSAADTRNTSHSSYVGRTSTNARGIASLGNLRMGNYFAREITPPAGHVLDATTYRVNLASTGTSRPSIARVQSSDGRRYGTSLQIRKVDKETGQAVAGGGASLAGAKFEIRWPDPSAASGWTSHTLTTNASGFAEYRATAGTRPGIPIGSFQIREIEAPEGYLIDPEFSNWRSFSATDSGGATRPIEISLQATLPRIQEQIIRGDLALRKYAEPEDEILQPLEGIGFHVIDNNPQNGDGAHNPHYGQIIATIFTDEEGYASTHELIPSSGQWGNADYRSGFLRYGNYLLREDPETTPEGLKPIDDMEFTISENGVEKFYEIINYNITASIIIVKRDAETEHIIPAAGTQFQIFDKDMQLLRFDFPDNPNLEVLTTDESGQIRLPYPLKYGDYYLQELQAPEGYLLQKEPLPFQVRSEHDLDNPLSICVDNHPAKAKVHIVKTDRNTASAIENTVFELRAQEDILTQDGSIRLKAGDLADVLITNEKGIAESIPLYLGKYELQEIEANPGYLIDPQIYLIELEYKDQNTELVWHKEEIQNEAVSVSCEIEKDTISISSAGYKSLPGEAAIDNSAQGSKELYRYDLNFRSTSNDWADEYVVIDNLEGVKEGQIRVEELWTPVVWGDSNGLYNLWYQTNLTDEELQYSESFAASKDVTNPANPERYMRFNNQGWQLWQEDLKSDERTKLSVSDLGLEDGEYITSLKLEYGRVEKGFTSKNCDKWEPLEHDAFFSSESKDALGLAPLSYLVYCPYPLDKFDPLTGEENIIYNSASSHITRNIDLMNDDEDSVETRLVDSFTYPEQSGDKQGSSQLKELSSPDDKSFRSTHTEQSKEASNKPEDADRYPLAHSPQTGDRSSGGLWTVLTVTALCIAVFAFIELKIQKKEQENEKRK